MSHIGGVIRRLREQQRLSLGQLQIKSGVTKSAIHQIEVGTTKQPKAITIARVAQALDVSVDYILQEAGILAASDNTALAPEVDHLNKIIQSYPPGPLRDQAEEIVIQIALALSHTLDKAKLDEIMAKKETEEEEK